MRCPERHYCKSYLESNWNKSVQQMYNSHEEGKKKEYGPRVLQVEKATMTAAVMREGYIRGLKQRV